MKLGKNIKQTTELGGLTLVTQGLGILGLYFAAQVMEGIAHQAGPKTVFIGIALFALFKVASATLNTWRDCLSRNFIVSSFDSSWKSHFPVEIQAHQVDKDGSFFQKVYEHIPRLVQLQGERTQLIASVVIIYGVYLFKVVSDGFLWALLYIPLLAGSAAFVTRFRQISFQAQLQEVQTERVSLLNWVRAFFSSNRELRFNWSDPGLLRSLYLGEGAEVHKGLQRHARLTSLRDFVGSMGVDWPYIFCLAATYLGASYHALTLAQLVFWLGLTDYLVNGNQMLRSVGNLQIRIRALRELIRTEAPLDPKEKPEVVSSQAMENFQGEFILQDGSRVIVGSTPGLYWIKGRNGSGKSTLINVLIGHENRVFNWDETKINDFRKQFSKNKIRILERSPTLFPDTSSFEVQTIGRELPIDEYFSHIHNQLDRLFSQSLKEKWLYRIHEVYSAWNNRPVKDLSVGEKVVLSFLRLLSHWTEEVRLVISDECDAGLDEPTRLLLFETFEELSKRIAIFFVSHTAQNTPKNNSWVVSSIALGVEKNQWGHSIPLSLGVMERGSGKVEALDPRAEPLVGPMRTALRAFVHSFPEYSDLLGHDYCIQVTLPGEKQIGQADSAGLAFAAALWNLIEIKKGRTPILFSATGQVHLDGSVLPVRALKEKLKAVSLTSKVLTPDNMKHLLEFSSFRLGYNVLSQ